MMPDPEQLDFDEELRRLATANPFVPFTVVTASGDRYDVPNSLWIAIGSDAVLVMRPRMGSATIRLYNIVALEAHESA